MPTVETSSDASLRVNAVPIQLPPRGWQARLRQAVPNAVLMKLSLSCCATGLPGLPQRPSPKHKLGTATGRLLLEKVAAPTWQHTCPLAAATGRNAKRSLTGSQSMVSHSSRSSCSCKSFGKQRSMIFLPSLSSLSVFTACASSKALSECVWKLSKNRPDSLQG